MSAKYIRNGLVGFTSILAIASALFIVGDYHRGQHSEFNVTGIGSVLLVLMWIVFFLVFAVVATVVRFVSKGPARSAALQACGLSLPIVATLLVASLLIAEQRTQDDFRQRCPGGYCEVAPNARETQP